MAFLIRSVQIQKEASGLLPAVRVVIHSGRRQPVKRRRVAFAPAQIYGVPMQGRLLCTRIAMGMEFQTPSVPTRMAPLGWLKVDLDVLLSGREQPADRSKLQLPIDGKLFAFRSKNNIDNILLVI